MNPKVHGMKPIADEIFWYIDNRFFPMLFDHKNSADIYYYVSGNLFGQPYDNFFWDIKVTIKEEMDNETDS